MNRRGFFRRTFGALATAAVAPFLPVTPAVKPLGLVFHPQAFSLVMKPLPGVTRMDVLFGFGMMSEAGGNFAVRVQDNDEPTGSFLKYIEHEREGLGL